jgi:hypothetical protein
MKFPMLLTFFTSIWGSSINLCWKVHQNYCINSQNYMKYVHAIFYMKL